jgi:carbon-monoxide dehydrogenase large subunit
LVKFAIGALFLRPLEATLRQRRSAPSWIRYRDEFGVSGMKFGIGQPMRRHEDLRLVTGRGRYTDDIILLGMTHAFVLRSPVAHAHIKRIDAATARRIPGVVFVATGEDVRADGLGDVPCMVPLVNRDGTPRHDTPRPVLALGKVRHVGQPVALVVAETLTAARDAAEAIDVEYEPLPAITEAKDAISPGAPQLFDHIPSNIVFDWDNDMGVLPWRRRPPASSMPR